MPGKCFFNIVFPLLRLLSLTFPRNTGVSRNMGVKRSFEKVSPRSIVGCIAKMGDGS